MGLVGIFVLAGDVWGSAAICTLGELSRSVFDIMNGLGPPLVVEVNMSESG